MKFAPIIAGLLVASICSSFAQNSASRLEVVIHKGFQTPVRHMAFSPDDRKLACRDEEGQVNVFDLQTYMPEKSIEKTKYSNGIFEFSASGSNLLFTGLEAWVLAEKPKKIDLEGSLVPLGHEDIYGYARDNFFGFKDSLFIFNSEKRDMLSQESIANPLVVPKGHSLNQFKALYPYAVLQTELDNEPIGSNGILMAKKRMLRIYHLEKKMFIDSIPSSATTPDFDIALQGKRLLVAQRNSHRLSDTLCRSTVELWEIDEKKRLLQKTTFEDAYEEFIVDLDLSADGSRLVLLDHNSQIVILPTNTSKPKYKPVRLPTYTSAILMNHTSNVIACAFYLGDVGLFLVGDDNKELTHIKTIKKSWLPIDNLFYHNNNLFSQNHDQVRIWPSNSLADTKAILPGNGIYSEIQPVDSAFYYWGYVKGRSIDKTLLKKNFLDQSSKIITLPQEHKQENRGNWAMSSTGSAFCLIMKDADRQKTYQSTLFFYQIKDTVAVQRQRIAFTVNSSGGEVPLSVSWSKALRRFVIVIRHLDKQQDQYKLHFFDENGQSDKRELTIRTDTGKDRNSVGLAFDYIELGLTPKGDAAYFIEKKIETDSCKLISLTSGKLLFAKNQENLGKSYYTSVSLEAFAADDRQAWIGAWINKKQYLLGYSLTSSKDSASQLLSVPGDQDVDKLRLSDDGTQIAGLINGVARVWNTQTGNELYALYTLRDSNYVAVTPDNYYMASKRSRNVQGLGFNLENNILPINQFDYQFNRPDIVSSRLPQADSQRVSFYHMLHKLRTNSGEDEPRSINDLPIVHLKKLSSDLSTAGRTYSFAVAGENSKGLKSVNVFINDVPVTHKARHSNKLSASKYTDTLTVGLGTGSNHIEVVTTDISDKKSVCIGAFDIICKPAASFKPRVYLVSVGVDKYQNSQMNLQYAVSDAKRMTDLFVKGVQYRYQREKDGLYEWDKEDIRGITDQFELDTLSNESFNKTALEKLKQKLMKSEVDDQIIFFYAGHGLLDKDYRFYLATSSTNFENPSENSIAYTSMVDLFKDIPARRKLFLIDACHAGEIVTKTSGSDNNTSLLAMTGRGARILGSSAASGTDISTYMRLFFSDYQTTDGINMIAASAGSEVALEGAQTEGGVFTTAVRQGLTKLTYAKAIDKDDKYRWDSGRDRTKYICTADMDQDGVVTVSELMSYTAGEVRRQTKGQQTPAYRIENFFNDFEVWSPNK